MSIDNLLRQYTPDETTNIKALLIGAPGSGKSTAAATFPNPVILDFDNNTPPEVKAMPGVRHLPLYDKAYRKEIVDGIKSLGPAAKRQYVDYAPMLTIYLLCNQLANELTEKDTLIFDSVSRYASMAAKMIDVQEEKAIEKNSYHRWAVFAETMETAFDCVSVLPCNQVAIMHEEELRDPESNRILAVRWLVDGKKFAHKVPQYFGNIFRCIRKAPETGKQFDANEKAKVEYYWQVQPDSKFPARTTIKTDKRYVTPSYESFK